MKNVKQEIKDDFLESLQTLNECIIALREDSNEVFMPTDDNLLKIESLLPLTEQAAHLQLAEAAVNERNARVQRDKTRAIVKIEVLSTNVSAKLAQHVVDAYVDLDSSVIQAEAALAECEGIHTLRKGLVKSVDTAARIVSGIRGSQNRAYK